MVLINGVCFSKCVGNIIEMDDLFDWFGMDVFCYLLECLFVDFLFDFDFELL